MEQNIIQQIIEAGNLAPSGGNSQPWRFEVRDNVIDIIALPEKDHPVLNFNNRGTFVAVGALMENIEIAAKSFGFQPFFEILPSRLLIRTALKPFANPKADDLFDAIPRRHTNRKHFSTNPLTASEKAYLFQESPRFPECALSSVEGAEIKKLAKNLAVDILIFLQNRLLHKLLFKEILWNKDEQQFKGGLYIRTMEAVPPKSAIFWLLKFWPLARFFSLLNLPQKIYEENSAKTASAGLLGIITVKGNNPDYFQAGRFLENIWLRAAKLGLGFQLVSGSLFLWQQFNFGNNSIFSEKEKKLIDGAYKELKTALGLQNAEPALAFRIGRAEPPLAVSYKRPPVIKYGNYPAV